MNVPVLLSETKFHDITPSGLHIVFRNNIENSVETLLTKLKTYKELAHLKLEEHIIKFIILL